MPVAPNASKPVMVIGAANIDIIGTAERALRMADSNPGRVHSTPGGVARNLAENLGRLGQATALCTVVGDDAFGAELLRSVRIAGVDTSLSRVLPGRSSSSYLSVHGPDGALAVAVNDMDVLEAIDPESLIERKAALDSACAWVLDCNLPEKSLVWLLEQPSRPQVYVDAVSAFKVARLRTRLGQIGLLKLNRLEARTLTGLSQLDGRSGWADAAAWLHEAGVRQVLLSLGDQGVYWSEPGVGAGLQPVLPSVRVNSTGAGDALLAGVVGRCVAGDSLPQAVAFGAACAALTLASPASCNPNLSPAAVRQLLQAAA